jgi:tRNA(fMet)-specific endonuclease VapC
VKYLLDANAWIHSLRGGLKSKVTIRLATQPYGSVHLCSIVFGELLYGAIHGNATHRVTNVKAVRDLRANYPTLPYEDQSAEEYAEIREDLAKKETPIGPNDMMIAAIAIANGLKLVTHNTAEFSRVPGLQLEDWQ